MWHSGYIPVRVSSAQSRGAVRRPKGMINTKDTRSLKGLALGLTLGLGLWAGMACLAVWLIG